MTICECEECVAARKWIVEKTGVGGGPKPLSFLIASHEHMAAERKKYEVSLKKHIELVDRLVKENRELERAAQELHDALHVWLSAPGGTPQARAAGLAVLRRLEASPHQASTKRDTE